MSPLDLILVPLLAALAVLLGAGRERAAVVLVGASFITTGLAIVEVSGVPAQSAAFAGLVRVDATSRLFLVVVNPIFFGISTYIWHRVRTTPALREGISRLVWLTLVFLASTNALLVANHLLALWVLLELTALTVTPMIVRRRSQASRRAAFRYLLFSGVGLGLASLAWAAAWRAAE